MRDNVSAAIRTLAEYRDVDAFEDSTDAGQWAEMLADALDAVLLHITEHDTDVAEEYDEHLGTEEEAEEDEGES